MHKAPKKAHIEQEAPEEPHIEREAPEEAQVLENWLCTHERKMGSK